MTQLVITQGDPQGVGPELLLRVAEAGLLHGDERVIAGRETMREIAAALGAPWAQAALERLEPLLDSGEDGRVPGRIGQYAALERAVDLVLGAQTSTTTTKVGEAEPAPALVTAPIDKSAASAEGLAHPGHTEYLAARAGVEDFAMLMAGPTIRVVLATIHVPLRKVAEVLDTAAVVRAGWLLAQSLTQDYAIPSPRIGVLGLNPHAGERGLLGSEEREIIEPAIAELRRRSADSGLGASFEGPLSADTAFHHHRVGGLEGLVAMYHDQGLGPFKLVHFHDGVNVTLGLPFVRTSPDHGTAKDIAGRGIADPASMIAAVELARAHARARGHRGR